MTVCLPLAQMNFRNLLGMDCINHLLNFLSWSVYLHLLLTISNLLILHTVLHRVLLFLLDPYSFCPRSSALWTPSCCGQRTGIWWSPWSGWRQTMLTCLDSLDHFCITKIWLLFQIQTRMGFRNLDSCSSFMWLQYLSVHITLKVSCK